MTLAIQNIQTYPELAQFIYSEPPNIINLSKDKVYRVILSDNTVVDMTLLGAACLYGKINHIKALGYSRTEINYALKACNYAALRYAAINGHTDTVKHLETHLTPEEKKEAVKAYNYSVIQFAVRNGHTATLKHLETHLTPEEKKAAVKVGNYRAVRETAENGHTDTLKHLETHLTPEEKKEAVKADNYNAIRYAAWNGHTDTLKHLETHLTAEEKKETVKADNYSVIEYVAINGHTDTVKHLETHLTAEAKKEVVKADNYRAIRGTAENGHTDTLKHLETHLTREEKKEAVKAGNYGAIRNAVMNGHTDTLKHLEAYLTPEEKKEAVKAGNYRVIQYAARNDHTDTLKHLATHLTAEEQKEAVQMNGYEVLRYAAQNSHRAMLHHFFKIDIALAYAEMHVYEYGSLVLPYVKNHLTALRANKLTLEAAHPNDVFDVSEDEACCLYYMVRHLIRRNTEEYRDDLLFLLDIPGVKNLAHRGINDGQENELLRLALDLGNQTAAQLLLNIPAVNDLARAQNYYSRESRGGFDLRALAANRESSMTALSQGEQQRLDKAISHYTPFIKNAGVANIMHDLRETLVGRYEEKPAQIRKDNGEVLALPLRYADFERLQLSEDEKTRALQAYYQHKDHTALRYLSRPNLWMSPRASFVNIDDTRTQRWSTFEEYEPLIAMLYCGARDEKMRPTDGFTLETRFAHFIDELAHIGRAHNWDNTRPKSNGDLEAYDDLEGDKPSCFSGVKRRLFQSVLGHPLLTILTEEIIQAEVDEFARAHFFECITDENRSGIVKALNKVVDGEALTDEDQRALESTDISEEKRALFISKLTEKYQAQFVSEPTFMNVVNQAIKEKRGGCAHILNFSAIIQSIVNSQQPNTTSENRAMGFFGSSRVDVSSDSQQACPPTNRRDR